MSEKKADSDIKTVARNRKARHLYHIEEVYEAGLVLKGTEVKSLRAGKASIVDAFGRIIKGEIWLMGSHIDEYDHGNRWNHDPRRKRKLLLHSREIRKLTQKINERGCTLVALSLYFVRGLAKVELGLARGKKMFDRREDLKQRDNDRDMRRALRREHEDE